MNPFQVVRDFEVALARYAGAPYCVATTSCTMALLLAVAWQLRNRESDLRQAVEIPKHTYVGVPQSIIHAGGWPIFREHIWEGAYELKPLRIWDSARWLTSDLYPMLAGAMTFGAMVCVSFHWSKHLAIGQGGAILHSDRDADAWLRRARFDGRAEGIAPRDDLGLTLGWHAYMMPRDAAEGLTRLALLPANNAPLPWGEGTGSDYPDLSAMEIFRWPTSSTS